MASSHQESLLRLLSHQLMSAIMIASSANPKRQSAYQGTGATSKGAICSFNTSGVPSESVAWDM